MNIWKILGGGCLGLIVFVGLIVGVVFWATSGITDTADDFFAAANDGDYEQAYSLTSQQLQGQIDADGLEAYLIENSLNQVTDTSWSSRSMENNTGELSGSVTTATGGEIPVTMELIKEGDDWRIKFIDVGNAGLESGGGGSAMTVPSPEGQMELVQSTTMAFADSLNEGNFTSFEERWVDEITVEQLEENLASFREFREEISAATSTKPAFTAARGLSNAGNLEVNGSYSTVEGELYFEYVFTGDGNGPVQIAGMDVEWK